MIPVAIFVARLLFSEWTRNQKLQIDVSELFPERALNKDQGGSNAAVVLQISTYFMIGGGYSFHPITRATLVNKPGVSLRFTLSTPEDLRVEETGYQRSAAIA